MEPRDNVVDLRFYLGVLRRRAWVVAAATVVVAALAFGVSLTQSEVYEAGADVLIGRQASDQVFVIGQGYDPRRNVQTEVQILRSRTVSDAASEAVGAPVSVRIVADDESDVVRVIARSSAPSFAARDANAYAKAYVDYRLDSTVQRLIEAGDEVTTKIAEIDAQIAALPATSTRRAPLEDQRAYLVEQQGRLEVSANLADAGGAAVLAEADVPVAPVEPKPLRNALLGAIRNDRPHNEAKRTALSNLGAIMGRAAVHMGRMITWDEMMESKFQFYPDTGNLTANSPAPVQADENGRYPAPIPGKTVEI